MKFTIILAVIALIGLSSASPATNSDEITVSKNAHTCQIGAPAKIDRSAMRGCLKLYQNGNWDGMNCGGRGWFKGGSLWDNPDHCYQACANCISKAINAGATDAQCDQTVVFASCWMGYH